LAAATLAALPLTIDFFKDELFFAAATEAGRPVQVMAIVAAALTVAYIGRFWLGLFTGSRGTEPRRVPALLTAPVALLALVAVAGGVVVEPFARLAEDAATITNAGLVELAPAYHLDAGAENVMAVLAWALGALILLAPRLREPVVRALSVAGDLVGPRRCYGAALDGLNRLSDRMHTAEVRDLRNSIAAVLVPTGLLVGLAFAVTPTEGAFSIGDVDAVDLPIIVLLGLAVAAGVTVARDDGRVRPILALSVLGFALAAVYAVVGAPDVALVAVLVESVVTIVFIGVYSRLPSDAAAAVRVRPPTRRWRNAVAGVLAGLGAFVTIWAALSRTSVAEGDSAEQIARTPDAHGGDVVTVILADFRGLDTMVEITVLAVAVVGVASLLRRGRTW
jgi:multicomponent Na+:H+ antiporter subunit A